MNDAAQLSDSALDRMTDRFLSWSFPENFQPDDPNPTPSAQEL